MCSCVDEKRISTKAWWKSKTVLFNGGIATLLIAENNIPSLQGLMPDWLHQVLVFSLPIVNLWLRAISSHGLAFRSRIRRAEVE